MLSLSYLKFVNLVVEPNVLHKNPIHKNVITIHYLTNYILFINKLVCISDYFLFVLTNKVKLY